MISPFIKIDVILKLSYRDLVILKKAIQANIPDHQAESAIVYIHEQVQQWIEKIEKA